MSMSAAISPINAGQFLMKLRMETLHGASLCDNKYNIGQISRSPKHENHCFEP